MPNAFGKPLASMHPLRLPRPWRRIKEVVDLDPTDAWSWIELGRLRRNYGTLADSRACFGAALQHAIDERGRMALHNEFGNLLMIEGELPEASLEYECGLAIAEKLAALEPGNSAWQRDLFVSNAKMGQLSKVAGNVDESLRHFKEAEQIMSALVQAQPENSEFARDLAEVRDEIARFEH